MVFPLEIDSSIQKSLSSLYVDISLVQAPTAVRPSQVRTRLFISGPNPWTSSAKCS